MSNTTRRPSAVGNTGGTTDNFIQKLRENAPNSTQLLGLGALVTSVGILLILTGLTATATILGIIFTAPLIIISSPVWIPVAVVLSITAAGTLSFIGFGLGSVAVLGWIYRYFKGFHPPGSDRFDYARSRIADTASHVKDYAIEYGGYLQSKVKDAAPGA